MTDESPALTHLALEATDLDALTAFYTDEFGLVPVERTERETAFDVGGTELVLRRPDSVPRGGLHVHYAFETTDREYPAWRARFPDAPEVSFGSAKSVYPFDPDGHCPEVGGFADSGQGLSGIFEIVLEVASVADAERQYRALGFEPIDRGHERKRVRLRGPADSERPFDLELWEPQLGLADARGGVHVDFGIRVENPTEAAERAFGDEVSVHPLERPDGSVELYDIDGHHVELHDSDPTDSDDSDDSTDSTGSTDSTDC